MYRNFIKDGSFHLSLSKKTLSIVKPARFHGTLEKEIPIRSIEMSIIVHDFVEFCTSRFKRGVAKHRFFLMYKESILMP